MKNICLFFIAMSLVSTQAQALEQESREVINAMKLEKMQVMVMVNRLSQSGRLSKEEAARAKREIASIQEESIEEIKSDALEKTLESSNSLARK